MQHSLSFFAGLLFLCVVLLDSFQTIILPRRPAGRLRITRLFFLATWGPWAALAHLVPSRRVRDQAYSIYGPLSLLMLISLWALLLISAFALIFYGLGAPLKDAVNGSSTTHAVLLRESFYLSGSTLFTLGLGDVTPVVQTGRFMVVAEAGVGLGFIALVIGYVPVLYGAFSRREVAIALLDARAGSPPTSSELLSRHRFEGGDEALILLLAEWERWCAEMLESHISYPILCYYRSQHDNQSWLSSITAILDSCALLITTVNNEAVRQAQLTFAIARHTLVDLGHVFLLDDRIRTLLAEATHPTNGHNRLPSPEYDRVTEKLLASGHTLCTAPDTQQRLASIRVLYEPQATAMAEYLRMELPPWMPAPPLAGRKPDQWTTVASLRSPLALAQKKQLTEHISSQSAASRLHDDESHPL